MDKEQVLKIYAKNDGHDEARMSIAETHSRTCGISLEKSFAIVLKLESEGRIVLNKTEATSTQEVVKEKSSIKLGSSLLIAVVALLLAVLYFGIMVKNAVQRKPTDQGQVILNRAQGSLKKIVCDYGKKDQCDSYDKEMDKVIDDLRF